MHSKGNHKQNEKTTHRMRENICKGCNQQGSKLFFGKQCDTLLWSEKTYTQDLAIPVLRVYTREVLDHEYQEACKNCIVHNNKKWNHLTYPCTVLWIDYCGIFTGKVHRSESE